VSQLRLGYPQFRAQNAEVVVVTATPPAQGAKYQEIFKFEHPYLCDPNLEAAKTYGLPINKKSVLGGAVKSGAFWSGLAMTPIQLHTLPEPNELKVLVAGQVEGGAYMGYGEAVMEQQVFRKGLHKIPSLLDYKLPTTLDTPEIETILIEIPDREGPFGGKEAGQGPLNPAIPAIANAVYDAIGVRIDEVPITPDKVLRALKATQATAGAATRPQLAPTPAPSPPAGR